LKIYGKKLKIEIPSIKIFIFLKNCVDKEMNIKEELEKKIMVDLGDIEKDEIFQEFKSDIKSINVNDKNRKNIYDIFTNKKAFLEEYLLLLQIVNRRNCEYLHCKTSIIESFEIVPLLLSLNKFEESKNILNALLQQKIYKSNKWNYTREYICLIFVMLLNCLEKNKENLSLMFKLLDTNFSKIKFFLKLLDSKDENLINDIISKYIESYSEIEDDNKDDKLDKVFSLDKAIDIKLDKIKDNIIFINKSKTKKEQIKFKFTNNTGISFNVDKIQLIFEEFASPNSNKIDNSNNYTNSGNNRRRGREMIKSQIYWNNNKIENNDKIRENNNNHEANKIKDNTEEKYMRKNNNFDKETIYMKSKYNNYNTPKKERFHFSNFQYSNNERNDNDNTFKSEKKRNLYKSQLSFLNNSYM